MFLIFNSFATLLEDFVYFLCVLALRKLVLESVILVNGIALTLVLLRLNALCGKVVFALQNKIVQIFSVL